MKNIIGIILTNKEKSIIRKSVQSFMLGDNKRIRRLTSEGEYHSLRISWRYIHLIPTKYVDYLIEFTFVDKQGVRHGCSILLNKEELFPISFKRDETLKELLRLR